MFSPRNLITPSINQSKHEDEGTPYNSAEEISSHYDTPELRSPDLARPSQSVEDLPRLLQNEADAVDRQEQNDEDRVSNDSADFGFMSFNCSPKADDYDLQELSDQEVDYSHRPDIMESSNTLGKDSLVKWKGIVLSPDEEYENESRLGVVILSF